MLKYSLNKNENNAANWYTTNRNVLETDTSKINDIILCRGPQTQQGFRQSILNLTGNEFQAPPINFTLWSSWNIKTKI